MLKEKTGRVTFMPLNRLKPKNPQTPNAQDAIPLIEKLSFAPEHQKAFQQVFGKTCVCRDLNIAAAYVKSHGINTITIDGDKVDRKGAMTGGYHDVRRSRIEAIKAVTTWRAKYESDEKRHREVKAAITQVEQRHTKVTGQISVLSNQAAQTRAAREALLDEGNTLNKEMGRLKERILTLERDVEELETELRTLGTNLEAYKLELRAPLAAGLSREEEGMLENLGKEVEYRRKNMVELGKNKNKACGVA
jgi:structural maintenance of chromosome 3 (chondroitin sulfate proteoglycan 6)